ncbi:hypothetical protein [Celeribacter sp.]|uniref:hypothetical protein n=1 Tax=Celeribacter sp. TaxID=1890673 RepID=UPI003A8D67F7
MQLAETRITHGAACEDSPAAQRADAIARALMGIGNLGGFGLSETASWERGDAPAAVGRAAISQALSTRIAPASIHIDQIVTQGKAATVSGRLNRDGTGTALFCHIIRFTSSAGQEIAQLVSFEQPERPKRARR